MTLRGKAAIVGIGEVPTRRTHPNRTLYGLNAEAARLAIEDARISKSDIDGIVTDGSDAAPAAMAEYIGIRPTFATGVTMQGASGATATTVAASAINAGLCETVLVVIGSSRAERGGGGPPGVRSEWEEPFGPAAGANTGYGLMFTRHMYEYGTTPEQMAKGRRRRTVQRGAQTRTPRSMASPSPPPTCSTRATSTTRSTFWKPLCPATAPPPAS